MATKARESSNVFHPCSKDSGGGPKWLSSFAIDMRLQAAGASSVATSCSSKTLAAAVWKCWSQSFGAPRVHAAMRPRARSWTSSLRTPAAFGQSSNARLIRPTRTCTCAGSPCNCRAKASNSSLPPLPRSCELYVRNSTDCRTGGVCGRSAGGGCSGKRFASRRAPRMVLRGIWACRCRNSCSCLHRRLCCCCSRSSQVY
mmetsp:Transcript_65024/g.151031  ORF Transcript_65024/g.151031 Transcript_65024/m.151031 type:complete len:200 (-) Transcript_65024:860-1459(-)